MSREDFENHVRDAIKVDMRSLLSKPLCMVPTPPLPRDALGKDLPMSAGDLLVTASLRKSRSTPLFHTVALSGGRRGDDAICRPAAKLSQGSIPSFLSGFRAAVTTSTVLTAHVAVPVLLLGYESRSLSPTAPKRISRRNADLRVEQSDSILDDEAYSLYRYYIESRHADGDMYPPATGQ